MTRLEVLSPDGVPEVQEGDDLAALLVAALGPDERLRDGDVVVVTSKVVSKAEGRLVPGDRDTVLPGEVVRVVARRGRTTIVRTRHGLTMAAAGIDASNVPAGRVALLPSDPDDSARRLRARLHATTGANLGVVVTDTAGRAWRRGQTDIAIGAAGVVVADDHAGRLDPHGHELAVTLPAVADEVASAAELAGGKLAGRPFAVLRGRPDLVLPVGDAGAGATDLVRPEGEDLFGLGAREAVVRALAGDPADRVAFGHPAPAAELAAALGAATGHPCEVDEHPEPAGRWHPLRLVHPRDHPPDPATLAAVCFAHGWEVAPDTGPDTGADTGRAAGASGTRVRPVTP